MKPSARPPAPKIALALAGGGPLGVIYEIGALCALQESLKGINFTKLQHDVGVSAGGFIAAGLANGITPQQLFSLFIEDRKSFMRALERLGPSLPTGVFSNERIHDELSRLFSRPGRSNDFRQLKSRLTLVTTHLDRSSSVAFGRPGWDHVPTSKAPQTSTEAMTPWTRPEPIPQIVDGGLPAVLSQTFRSLIHSRMVLRLKSYEQAYPNTDILLFEPDHSDSELYLANTFSYSQRRHVAEHAYQQTRHAGV